MFAVAGAGKTTYIVNSLSPQKRSLIVTYTIANYLNLQRKINQKFDDNWPDNIVLMRYVPFLYRFCFKPFLSDRVNAKGIIFQKNPLRFPNHKEAKYYLSNDGFLYSNRIAQLIEVQGTVELVKDRLQNYFDEFIIDEVQDIAGRDFDLMKLLMTTDIGMLLVGDFFQHTFDTSTDGNVNASLFQNKSLYESVFSDNGITVDNHTLSNSWRCSQTLCTYVRDNLHIDIHSNRSTDDDTSIVLVDNPASIKDILRDPGIVKLHYQKASDYGFGHRNWGETKGEDHYQDVCVLMNPNSMQKLRSNRLHELPQRTKNKLYVALTRAHGNVYIIEESVLNPTE